MAAPETYWEKRCYLNEQVLHRLMLIVGEALHHTQDHIKALGDKWDEAIEKLDIEEAADAQ